MSTAVAQLSNGTIVKLAKIAGTAGYQELLQSELQKRQVIQGHATPHTRAHASSHGVAVLAEMIVSLREASEAILGDLPATVAVTAPYVLAWLDEETDFSSYVWRARELAGLKSFRVETMSPLYLAEASTVFAANGRCLCQDRYCYGPERTEEDIFTHDVVYHISFTNNSLYTVFQRATCFFHSPAGARYGTINHDFGLGRTEHGVAATFWLHMEEYLVSQAEKYVKSDVRPTESYIIAMAGEAAENKEFRDTVARVAARIQGDEAHRSERTGAGPKIELLASKEPVYAAAIGAALSKRHELDHSYCDEYFKSGIKVTDLHDDSRDEL
ncbi:hypothetical protein NOR_08756 [Metarhizium rileyi]|uniref:Uncharacterized protein n=1 Tax=Metarhizium rileyi (strain RCEF 4871) TaxID=1649241 RepID=A0A166VP57_METRR|nr:hypothetical protein NOR_08756 [Metarhizium rileyi RCEF 4871]